MLTCLMTFLAWQFMFTSAWQTPLSKHLKQQARMSPLCVHSMGSLVIKTKLPPLSYRPTSTLTHWYIISFSGFIFTSYILFFIFSSTPVLTFSIDVVFILSMRHSDLWWWLGIHCIRQWLVTSLVPSQCLNQWLHIVNWTHRKTYSDVSNNIQIFSIQNIELNDTHIVQANVWSGWTINIG